MSGTPRLVQNAQIMDLGAMSTAVGTLFDHLPKAAALLSVLWLGIQMYESKTGSHVRRRVREFLLRRGPF